jgi:hypothetical protein
MEPVTPNSNPGDTEKQQSKSSIPLTSLATTVEAPRKKPFSFYMSFLSLGLLALISSWDATSLAIALPVRSFHS